MSRRHEHPKRTSSRSFKRVHAARLLALTILAAAGSCTSAQQSNTAPTVARCTLTVRNSIETAPAAGGSATLSIGAARDCAWSASSGAAWVVITSAPSGQGDGSLSYRVNANTESAPRRTTIDVNSAAVTINQAAACRYRVAPLTAAVDAAGGTVTVDVQTDASCEWSAASDAGWIRLTDSGSRTGNGAITLTVDAVTGGVRSGTIRVAGQTVTLTQAASACSYKVSPAGGTIPAAGGSTTASVSVAAHCPWTAISAVPWVTIASGAAGTGTGSVQLNVAANPGAARTGTATIAAQTLTLTQAAAPCTFTMSPGAIDVPSAGGERTTTVTTRDDCAWTASANVPWITVTAAASATGSATIRFTVAANSGDARSGVVSIGGATVTVAQDAAPCTFAFSTASQTYDAAGGYGAVGLMTRQSCAWTANASSNGDWLVITDRGAGTGSGTINFSVAVNAGPERTGSLTVGGQTFWVIQRP
jgi:hypothetical protein